MITLRTSTGDEGVAAMTLRTPTGDKVVARATLRTPTGDEVVFDSATASGLTVEIEPPAATGATGSASTTTVDTNQVTAVVTGGTEPYSYSWVQDSGDADWSAVSPSAQATRFRKTNLASDTSSSAVFEVTVTDDRGRTGTAQINVQAINFGGTF